MKKSTCNVLIKTCKVKRDDKIQYNGLKNCLKVFETKKNILIQHCRENKLVALKR